MMRPPPHAPMRRAGPNKTIFIIALLLWLCAHLFLHFPAQLTRRLRIEFKTPILSMDHHAIISSCRLERYILRTNVGKHAVRIALEGIAKPAAAPDLDL